MGCRKEYKRNKRARQREYVLNLKRERGCKLCGEKDPACLDFHHRDSGQKKGTVSQMASKTSMGPLLKEIEKCDLLCANCHRKLHHEEKLRAE